MSLKGKIAPRWEPLDITLEKDNWFYVPWDSSTNSNGAQAVVFYKSLTRPILPRFSTEGSHRTNGEGSLDGWFFCVFLRKSVQHLVRKYVSTDYIQCIVLWQRMPGFTDLFPHLFGVFLENSSERNLLYPRSQLFPGAAWIQSLWGYKGPLIPSNLGQLKGHAGVLIAVSESAPQWIQPTTTHKTQFLFPGADSHMHGAGFVSRGCTSGTSLPFSALSLLNTLHLIFQNVGSADKFPKRSTVLTHKDSSKQRIKFQWISQRKNN